MLRILTKILFLVVILIAGLWAYTYASLVGHEHEYAELSAEQMQQAETYLKGKIHEEPEGWSWQTFQTEASISLRSGRADHPEAKGTIIFVPGFTGTLEMSMDVIHGLHAAGFNVAGVEYRGQGGSYRPLSDPEKGYVESYKILADELAEFANHHANEDLPLFFYSISKGAHITMRMAALGTVNVDAYAVIVPMIKVNSGEIPYGLMDGLATSLNALGLGKMYAPGQTSWPPSDLEFGVPRPCNANPETAQLQSALFAFNPELRAYGATVKWIYETTRSTRKLLSDGFMDKLDVPVLMFSAGDETFVDNDVARQFCEDLVNCREQHFPKARHCINPESTERSEAITKQATEFFLHSIAQKKAN